MKKVLSLFESLLFGLNYVGCGLILILTGMIMIDVTGRLLLNKPLIGTAEVVQCSIVAIAFLMIPYVQLNNGHLNVTMLYGKMNPQRGQRIVDCVTCIFGIIMFSIVAYSSYVLLKKGIAVHEYEGDGFNVKIPSWIVRGTITFCSIANVFVYFWQLVNRMRGKEMEK